MTERTHTADENTPDRSQWIWCKGKGNCGCVAPSCCYEPNLQPNFEAGRVNAPSGTTSKVGVQQPRKPAESPALLTSNEKNYEAALIEISTFFNGNPLKWPKSSDACAMLVEIADKALNAGEVNVQEQREYKALYEAGVAAWNPVYKIVLDERDQLRAELAALRTSNETGVSDAPPERYFRYYRDVLKRIANGYDTPQSLATLALDWEIPAQENAQKASEGRS